MPPVRSLNMDKKTMLKSSMQELELVNGEKIQLTLNFKRLLNVRNKRKDLYRRYNDIMMNGPKDMFHNITILYVAYLCAIDDPEDMEVAMDEGTFMELLPEYNVIMQKVMDLVSPKKPEASEEHSEEESQKEEEELRYLNSISKK